MRDAIPSPGPDWPVSNSMKSTSMPYRSGVTATAVHHGRNTSSTWHSQSLEDIPDTKADIRRDGSSSGAAGKSYSKWSQARASPNGDPNRGPAGQINAPKSQLAEERVAVQSHRPHSAPKSASAVADKEIHVTRYFSDCSNSSTFCFPSAMIALYKNRFDSK